MTGNASDLRPLPANPRRRQPRRTADRDPLRDRSTAECARPSRRPPAPTSPHGRSPRSPRSTDVYVGVLLRRRRAGGRDACERSHLAFVEIDRSRRARSGSSGTAAQPTMMIASGGTPDTPTPTGSCSSPSTSTSSSKPTADSRTTSAATSPPSTPPASSGRRPPGTGKRTPPTPVELLVLQPARRYQLDELTAGLTDPSPPRRSTSTAQPRRDQRSRPAAARDSRRHLRASAHRPPAQPRRQNLLPVSRLIRKASGQRRRFACSFCCGRVLEGSSRRAMSGDAGARRQEAGRYVRALFGRAPERSLVELRFRVPSGMAQRFVPASRQRDVVDAVLSLAVRTEVFVGVLPRARPGGRLADVVHRASVLWADCDTPASVAALARSSPGRR